MSVLDLSVAATAAARVQSVYCFLGREKNPHVLKDRRMEEQSPPPPSKAPRVSDAGTVMMASPSIALGLGLGLGLGPGTSCFTFLQLQELEHQALIYKYMAAGVPVPFHLVLPIWKSVAGSSYQHHYPTFMGCSSLCFDYRNTMDPEPGRCRRTDGKKWRCSKDVVPDQKYCERHMHRGRNRSRKPVEGAPAIAAAASTTTSSSYPANLLSNNTSTQLSISIPTGLQLMPTTSTVSNSNSTISPPRSGFSPTSVLPTGTCKTSHS